MDFSGSELLMWGAGAASLCVSAAMCGICAGKTKKVSPGPADPIFNSKIQQIKAAFDRDGWIVDKTMGLLMGMLDADDVKKMADEYTLAMPANYLQQIPNMPGWLVKLLSHVLINFGYWLVASGDGDNPLRDTLGDDLYNELEGLRDGCERVGVKVSRAHLVMLNMGADLLCAIAYEMGMTADANVKLVKFLEDLVFKLKDMISKKRQATKGTATPKALAALPEEVAKQMAAVLPASSAADLTELKMLDGLVELVKASPEASSLTIGQCDRPRRQLSRNAHLPHRTLRAPHACNAFIARGEMTSPPGQTFMGRDFMFDTFRVLNLLACFTIRQPVYSTGPGILNVSWATAAMVGAITGVNAHGVGIGVDMLPAKNNDAWHGGMNSLLLNRDTLERATDTKTAVDHIRAARRTASWIHPVGSPGQGCIVEATAKHDVNTGDFVDERFKPILAEAGVPFEKLPEGICAYWMDDVGGEGTKTAEPYIAVNQKLFSHYRKLYPSFGVQYNPQGYTGKLGFINQKKEDRNCCGLYYLQPIRRSSKDVIVTTNSALTLLVRLLQMNRFLSDLIAGSDNENEIQWRYDTLTERASKPMTWERAHWVIELTSPNPATNPEWGEPTWKDNQIRGGICLMDLKDGCRSRIDGHYGFWVDEWVSLALEGYGSLDSVKLQSFTTLEERRYGAAKCDPPAQLLDEMLARTAALYPDPDMVFFLGDAIAHNDITATNGVIEKAWAYVLNAVQATWPKARVYPVFGNHETYPCNWLAPVAGQEIIRTITGYWTERGWLRDVEDQKALSDWGFYTVLHRPGHRIVAINNHWTNGSNKRLDDKVPDPTGMRAWLSGVISRAAAAGEKVWLIGHIRPNSGKAGWPEFFNGLLAQHPGTIVREFYGHTHTDELMLGRVAYGANTSSVGWVSPASTTYEGIWPSVRAAFFDPSAAIESEVHTYHVNVDASNAAKSLAFEEFYEFREAYGMADLSPESFDVLLNRMLTEEEQCLKDPR
eukprot:m51a1_g10917 hypothetical protein (997) ;mRNA; f:87748-92523